MGMPLYLVERLLKNAVPRKSLTSQPVIPSEAALGTTRNLFVALRFLARKERSLGMTKASFALLHLNDPRKESCI